MTNDALREEAARLNRELNFRDLAADRYGAEWRGSRTTCLVHRGDGLNFSYFPATNTGTCHSSCGKTWSVIDLVMEMENLTFPEAVRALGGKVEDGPAAAALTAASKPRSNTPAAPLTLEALAADKGLPADWLRQECGMYSAGSAVCIPYRLEDGQSTGRTRLRTALRATEGSLWKPGKEPIVPYGLWRLAYAGLPSAVWIVEGESDCWTLWFHGYAAIGMPGAGMAGKLEAGHLERFDRLNVIEEPDKAGRKFPGAVARRAAELGWKGQVFAVRLDAAKDPNGLHKLDPTGFDVRLEAATRAAESVELEDGTVFGTDMNNAARLVRLHSDRLRYCWEHGRWYSWDSRRWRPDLGAMVSGHAKQTVRAMLKEALELGEKARSKEERQEAEDAYRKAVACQQEKRIEAMIRLARSESTVPILPAELDCDPWKLNVLNGTIDLRTGRLAPHDPADLITKLAPVDYSPDAACPIWDAFLRRIFDGNDELIAFVQRAAGYALTADTSEQVLFFLYGKGANGKSTWLGSMQAALGDYGSQAAPDLLTVKKNESHPTEIADLAGARFVATIEIGEGKRMAEALVKQMTGQDRMKARFMRQDFWWFDPTFKLFLAANHKPAVRGGDEGIWRRILLVPFTVTIPEAERDRRLPDKLKAELPGILAWAVRGCLEWQRVGLKPPPAVLTATAAYRDESDTLGAFVADCLELRAGSFETSASIQSAAGRWCHVNGEREFTAKAIGARLTELGCERFKGGHNNHRSWRGVRLRPEWQAGQQADAEANHAPEGATDPETEAFDI